MNNDDYLKRNQICIFSYLPRKRTNTKHKHKYLPRRQGGPIKDRHFTSVSYPAKYQNVWRDIIYYVFKSLNNIKDIETRLNKLMRFNLRSSSTITRGLQCFTIKHEVKSYMKCALRTAPTN